VQAGIVSGDVTAAVAHAVVLAFAAGFDLHGCADGVAIAVSAAQTQPEPIVPVGGLIVQQQRLTGDGQHDDVEFAVVIEVALASAAI
jgi:hypothetical protein